LTPLECAKVPTLVTSGLSLRLVALAALVAAPGFAHPDVVHMKNGDVIYADRVTEKANTVQYDVGDDSYTVPKSRVERVEAGVPIPSRQIELPNYTPSAPAVGESELLDQIVVQGSVNREALNQIESRGNAALTAVAFYIAGKQEFQKGRFEEARRDFEAGLRYDAQNPAIVNFYAALLVRTGHPRDAVEYAERAVRLAPDSPDALAVLGTAQYSAGYSKDAAEAWKKSIALRPDASIQAMIDRVGRELTAENNFSRRETGHFALHYEGGQSSEFLREQILTLLEAAYGELSRVFNTEPHSRIEIILYTNQAFFDVTHAASWMGAINDGKVRIPVQGLNSITPDLVRILKHELTHSFVNQMTMGRCPYWLNEGIAQALEPKTLGIRGARLGALFQQDHEIPLNALEGSFVSFSPTEALLAYDESLATVDYLQATYGVTDLVHLLDKIGHGDSAESALRSTFHSDYRQLQSEVGNFLIREYRN